MKPGPLQLRIMRPRRKITPRSYSRSTRIAFEIRMKPSRIRDSERRETHFVSSLYRSPNRRPGSPSAAGPRLRTTSHLLARADRAPPLVAFQSSPWTKTLPCGSSADRAPLPARRPGPRAPDTVRRPCARTAITTPKRQRPVTTISVGQDHAQGEPRSAAAAVEEHQGPEEQGRDRLRWQALPIAGTLISSRKRTR